MAALCNGDYLCPSVGSARLIRLALLLCLVCVSSITCSAEQTVGRVIQFESEERTQTSNQTPVDSPSQTPRDSSSHSSQTSVDPSTQTAVVPDKVPAEDKQSHSDTSPVLPGQDSQDSQDPTPSSHWPGMPPWNAWSLPRSLLRKFPSQKSSTLDPSKFRLDVKLLTFNRVVSAQRFLNSLSSAEFLGDQVDLVVLLDHPFGAPDKYGEPKKVDLPAAQKEHDAMLAMLDAFDWPHGSKSIFARTLNGGIQQQWMEAWWPESVNHFAFVAEDDCEVSPFFYVFLKRLIMFYYYNQSNFRPDIFGLTFHHHIELIGKGADPVEPPLGLFLYPFMGTWGQILFPIAWKEYRTWYNRVKYIPKYYPIVLGTRITTWWWWKRNLIWTPWFMRWAHERRTFNIFTRFPNNLTLSISYREAGVDYNETFGADGVLIDSSHVHPDSGNTPSTRENKRTSNIGGISPLDLLSPSSSESSQRSSSGSSQTGLPEWWTSPFPPSKDLPKFDWCFREILHSVPLDSFDDLIAALPTFGAEKELTVIPMSGTYNAFQFAKNWLCSIDGLNRHNYLLLFTLLPLKSISTSASDVCAPTASNMNRESLHYAKDLASSGHLVYLTQSPERGQDTKCNQETLAAWKSPLLLSQHAEFVGRLLEHGVSVLISSLGTQWPGDPATCLYSSDGGPQLSTWATPSLFQAKTDSTTTSYPSLAHPKTTPSFISWIKSSSESVSQFKEFLKFWKSKGVMDLLQFPESEFPKLKKLLNVTEVSDQGSGGGGDCIANVRDKGRSNGMSVILASTNVNLLKGNKLWRVQGPTLSCIRVTCKRNSAVI